MADMHVVRRGNVTSDEPWGNDTPYYWEGDEFGGWVEGLIQDSAILTKEINHLKIVATNANGNGVWVKDVQIDVTNISTLYVDWVGYDSIDVGTIASLRIGGLKTDAAFDARVLESIPFARKISALDVSTLTGSTWLKLTCYRGKAEFYRVWGEV